jgi:hypothetical protein
MASYFWLDGSNNRYYQGNAFNYNNIQYTSAGATPATFTSLGFTQVTIQAKPDTRFYSVTGPNDSGAWTAVAKPLAELKDFYIERCRNLMNAQASGSGALSELIYAFKDSGTIATDWTKFLSAIKTRRDEDYAVINAAADVPAIAAIADAPEWVLVDPNDTSDGYQINPNPHLHGGTLNPHELEEIYGTIVITRAGANLTSALFGSASDDYSEVRGVFAYDLVLHATHSGGTTLPIYNMPNGFSGTGCFPASGDTTVELRYSVGGQTWTIATLTVTDNAAAQTFTFGNQY